MDAADFFGGKTVALVGPSRGIVGSGAGAAIEAFDLVARMNHQWPVAPERTPDIGSRMDVLFHCCNGDYPVARFAREDFGDTRIVFYESGPDAPVLTTICRELAVPAEDVTATYRALRADLGAFPSTGLVAIARLLELPIAQLHLFGITFCREPYYAGYLGHGAAPQYWSGDTPVGPIWHHDMEREFLYFSTRFREDPRLRVDGRSASVMKYRATL